MRDVMEEFERQFVGYSVPDETPEPEPPEPYAELNRSGAGCWDRPANTQDYRKAELREDG